MSRFTVIALPSETAAQVRSSGKAPRYGHPAHTELASATDHAVTACVSSGSGKKTGHCLPTILLPE